MFILLFCLLAYLIGSISFALIIGKVFYHVDLRKEGSGNLGATNTFRILGKKAGFVVMIGDVLKGTLAAILPSLFGFHIHIIIVGIFAVIGHVFPLYSGFKGGKAVATTSGVILAFNPLLFLVMFALFILYLYLTKIVSLASILASLSLFASSFYIHDKIFIYFSTFIFLFILFKHKENIKRIKNKTEPKIKWM